MQKDFPTYLVYYLNVYKGKMESAEFDTLSKCVDFLKLLPEESHAQVYKSLPLYKKLSTKKEEK